MAGLALLNQRLANVQNASSEFCIFVQDAWFLMKDYPIADFLILERAQGKYEQAQNPGCILLYIGGLVAKAVQNRLVSASDEI